jgi:hypothetical protein
MKHALIGALISLTLPLAETAPAVGQEREATANSHVSADHGSSLVLGHPFAAIKYARRVRVLPDGKHKFIRNERYPTRNRTKIHEKTRKFTKKETPVGLYGKQA